MFTENIYETNGSKLNIYIILHKPPQRIKLEHNKRIGNF